MLFQAFVTLHFPLLPHLVSKLPVFPNLISSLADKRTLPLPRLASLLLWGFFRHLSTPPPTLCSNRLTHWFLPQDFKTIS